MEDTEFYGYAILEDGSTIDLIQSDYEALTKMLLRNVERMSILKNGDLLKSGSVYYLGTLANMEAAQLARQQAYARAHTGADPVEVAKDPVKVAKDPLKTFKPKKDSK